MCARFTLAVPDFAALLALLEASAAPKATPSSPSGASAARGADLRPAGGDGAGPARGAGPGIDVHPAAAALYRPRYNIAPAQAHLVLRTRTHDGRREILPASWGFRGRFGRGGSGPDRLANARAESARTKPTFRGAFAAHRCVVPADGFYEWSGPKGARRPTWFHPAAGGLLRFAGLCEPAKDAAPGEPDWSFTLLTTSASEDVAPVHDRMPVILDPADVDLWLDPGADLDRAEALLRPAPRGALAARAVSPRVNSVAHDDASLLREIAAQAAAPAAAGTLPLFDLDGGAAPPVPSGRTARR